MYKISKEDTKYIAGGIQTYVTQEWKDTQALCNGLATGLLMSVIITGVIGIDIPFIVAGGMIGYGFAYSMNTYENALLNNDTWYDIQPIRTGFQRPA